MDVHSYNTHYLAENIVQAILHTPKVYKISYPCIALAREVVYELIVNDSFLFNGTCYDKDFDVYKLKTAFDKLLDECLDTIVNRLRESEQQR